MNTRDQDLPLHGVLVVDCSRMLPGAVLARVLLDLGARLVKVEDPAVGESMRMSAPYVDGMGAGYTSFLRGAESLCLDLKSPLGARALGVLAQRGDVLVESFRPGTMERWGLGADALREDNPGLVFLSMSGFGSRGPWASRVAHDMNLTAAAGLLDLVRPAEGIPRAQLADVTTALLACSSILAALLRRSRTGRGATIDQPLASGMLPFLTWAWADAAAGPGSIVHTILAGKAPAYRTYPCGDGQSLALGTLEPKFWVTFVQLIDRPHLAGAGLDLGEGGAEAAREVAEALAAKPRDHWVDRCLEAGLPVTPVRTVEEALDDRFFDEVGLAEPVDDGPSLPGSFLPSVAPRRQGRAPRHGEHTEAILAELGLDEEG